MTAGALRKRLTLQSESVTPDGSGGYAGNWTAIATLWGEITPSTRYYDYTNSERRVTHSIRVRYRNDVNISTGMRLVYGSRAFTIRYIVIEEEKKRWLELLVEEGGLLG